MRDFTGDVLHDPRVTVIPYDGRLYLAHAGERFDVIDLSLANSVGLSNPGGFAIVERYAYTREAVLSYMRALAPGGVLAITLWNKEEPPKSVFKLYATMAAAAKAFDPETARDALFAASSYLSTTTVLYKEGGSPAEIERLAAYSEEMSWDVVYAPGMAFDPAEADGVLDDYRQSIFGTGEAPVDVEAKPFDPTTDSPVRKKRRPPCPRPGLPGSRGSP